MSIHVYLPTDVYFGCVIRTGFLFHTPFETENALAAPHAVPSKTGNRRGFLRLPDRFGVQHVLQDGHRTA